MIFDEVEKLYDQSSLLREACVKKPIRSPDNCYLKFKAVAGKTPANISAIPVGDGCLANDSNYLQFEDRFDKIANAHDISIDNNHYIDRKEFVWSNGKFRESDRTLCNGVKDTIKFKTKKGFRNEGTPNHRFKIVRANNIEWCRFDSLVLGDKILIDRSYRWHNGSSDVTEEQAYALGLMIGDGSYCNKYKMRYTTCDIELVNAVNKGTGFVFNGILSDDVHFDCYGVKKVAEWLDFWGMEFTYTKDKKLPAKMLSASRDVMSKCISGLFDSDGHIQVTTWKGGVGIVIGFTNTSEELVNQLHYILLHYGIVAYKTERDRDPNWNTVYELLITGADVKIFYDKIGFGLKRKQDILESAVKNKTRWVRYDHIPNILKDMIRVSETNGLVRGKGNAASTSCSTSKLKARKGATQYLADNFLETYGHIDDPLVKTIKTLANPNIYYDEIVSIGSGKCVTYDIHVPEGNEYCANGFFSHNSKIRGSRFYLILVDELAQVPAQILDLVIRPFGAASLAPMERVRRVDEQNRLIKAGLATKEDFQVEKVNKMIMTSSGYYKFNHMWGRMQDHWKMVKKSEAEGKESPYAVWQVPHWDLPDGFLDKNNIAEAKRIMTSNEYSMEYEAAMVSDSEGFFKASLLEECSTNSGFTLIHKGVKNKEYVIGVDPNQGGSASCGVVILSVGSPNKIVNILELKTQTTQELTKAVQSLCEQYKVLRIFMDRGGGGKAVMDLLEEGYGGVEPILDRTNPDNNHKDGRHILEMVNFNPGWISDANFTTKRMFESKNLMFPELPVDANDLLAKNHKVVLVLKSQLLSIVVTQTTTGILHFDTPTKSMNKDLYSALILAAHGIRMIERELEEEGDPILHTAGGMVRQRDGNGTFDYLGAVSALSSGPEASKLNKSVLAAAVLKKKKK